MPGIKISKATKISAVVVTLTIVIALTLLHKHAQAPNISNMQQTVSTQPDKSNQDQKFNKNKYSLTEPGSLWFIANKHFGLPSNYKPSDLEIPDVPHIHAAAQGNTLRHIAIEDLKKLVTAANSTGLQLEFGSGFRSYEYQSQLYNGYVSSMGRAEADRSSARPGHSEHQTGLALDFLRTDDACHLESCFAETPEGKWLAANAYKYGFILRYPKDKESVTGYMYEPWHFRYVGTDLAIELHNKNIETLEEYFETGPAPDYL